MAMQALPEPTTTRAIKQQNEKPDVSFAASNLEDEIIRLARERLEQTRQLYQAKHVSLSQVDEAEGELALAEARGDLVKRAEARLTMATKYLERIEGVHRTGNISEAEYNQAKQRKLEAELELQRARTTAFPKAEKNSGAAVVTRSFPLHHRLASETSDDLRQILSGKPGHEAKPSADNQELRVTAPPEEMSRVVALELSYRQFDQTPHSGWRVLAQDEKRFREAAALIEAYLLHDGLDASERVNLHFHAAQCLASAGDAKSVLDALGHLKQARYTAEPPDAPLRWNDYVGATEAFLKGDLDALKAARERIAAGPKLNGMPANLDVVDRLIARFGQPYRQAYLSEPEDAGRTVEAPGK
jgi:hypothetical protein